MRPESEWVESNALAFALRDKYAVAPGHTLVITRRVVPTWFDATADEKAAILDLVEVVKARLDATRSPDGYNVGFNAGSAAGQTVMHLHVHVIPRYRGDMDDPRGGVRGVIPSKQKYSGAPAADAVREAELDAYMTHAATTPLGDLSSFVDGKRALMVDVLRSAVQNADEIDMVPAFVQTSGLALIEEDLVDALQRGATLRILTGDYMGITSADALAALLSLSGRFAQCTVRVHEVAPGASFHPKAYLFWRAPHGVAFVGSSNLSKTALMYGIEWNLRIVSSEDRTTFDAIRSRFEDLWTAEQVRPLTKQWIDEYRKRAPVRSPPAPEPRGAAPEPHVIQARALSALRETRERGHVAGLVVMATGLGKTFLSAFDFAQMKGKRALFVAHREEILDQARTTWERVLPGRITGTLIGSRREVEADLVFASVQTLSRRRHLDRFAADHFDYVVIDEFHHAAAASYRRLIDHFTPNFLLGLTATPDRMDGAQLLELCGDNEVFRCGLLEAIREDRLVPFRYHGVKDELDFAPIPWRSGKFDPDALAQAVETRQRAAQALREYRRWAPENTRRTLAFCVSTTHADFMAAYFVEHGLRAVAVHSNSTSSPRADSLRKLAKGELEIICAVDVFNEGVDIPEVDTVLMLRPTASPVIYMQQIGRGLRKSADKPHLTIVDFIGNHRSFLQRPQALVYLTGKSVTGYEAVRLLLDKRLELPEGCSVDIETEALDMLRRLAGSPAADTLDYEYTLFRDTHGRRPTASELFQELGTFTGLWRRHSTYFDLARHYDDLTVDEERALERHRAWFNDLSRTKLTKSFKLIALLALLDAGALTTQMTVRENAERSDHILRRHAVLRRELTEGSAARQTFNDAFVSKWREMPLNIWTGAKSTSRAWFALDGDEFRSKLEVATDDIETFDAMTLEIVESRLAERVRSIRASTVHQAATESYRLKVSHSSGRPILFLDRDKNPGLPANGDIAAQVGNEEFFLHVRNVAINKATRGADSVNVLPSILRGWFGPKAGHPGRSEFVVLERADSGWQLRAESNDARAVLPVGTPSLALFEDLRVACGAIDRTPRDAASDRRVRIRTELVQDLDPTRHFVVRATGGSMDGGDRPISDNDLVLCEWIEDPAKATVSGAACLLQEYQADGGAEAKIKVPRRIAGTWTLESWNREHALEEIPPGARLEPIAHVLGVVKEDLDLDLWGTYRRQDIAEAFGREYSAWWRAGHRNLDVHGRPHAVLMVTLLKGSEIRREEHYDDRFLSADEFAWESQKNVDATMKTGRAIVEHEAQGRTIHLFVRLNSKVKGKSQPFVYCGPVTYVSHEDGKPMRVWFELMRALPDSMLNDWRT